MEAEWGLLDSHREQRESAQAPSVQTSMFVYGENGDISTIYSVWRSCTLHWKAGWRCSTETEWWCCKHLSNRSLWLGSVTCEFVGITWAISAKFRECVSCTGASVLLMENCPVLCLTVASSQIWYEFYVRITRFLVFQAHINTWQPKEIAGNVIRWVYVLHLESIHFWNVKTTSSTTNYGKRAEAPWFQVVSTLN